MTAESHTTCPGRSALMWCWPILSRSPMLSVLTLASKKLAVLRKLTQGVASRSTGKQWKVNGIARLCKMGQGCAGLCDYLAKVGVEGSNPFARSKILLARLKLQ